MMRRPCTRRKKSTPGHRADGGAVYRQGTALKAQAQQQLQELAKIMRRFGRQCRGQGKVFVSLVRQTETHLLTTGEAWWRWQAPPRRNCRAPRVDGGLAAAVGYHADRGLGHHQQIATQSRRLTHGKPLTRCKIVNAYDATIAPICKGKSNCPTQFGRKPGPVGRACHRLRVRAQLPVGNPSDASYVLPLVDQVQHGMLTSLRGPLPAIHRWRGIWL